LKKDDTIQSYFVINSKYMESDDNQHNMQSDVQEVNLEEQHTAAMGGLKKFIAFFVIIFVGILAILALIDVQLFLSALSFLWTLVIILVVIFFILGIFILVGLRNEVGELIGMLFDGSMKMIDFVNELKKIYERLIEMVENFLIAIAPILAIAASVLIYFGLIYLYKWVGRNHDVTMLTTVLTVVLVVAIGLLAFKDTTAEPENFMQRLSARFIRYFRDTSEIMLFIFFLTMDSVHLFFLPKDLNVPLHAHLFGYDLMEKGIDFSRAPLFILNLIVLAVFIEIIRKALRIALETKRYYLANAHLVTKEKGNDVVALLKFSLKGALDTYMDDIVKFVAFTTLLIIVFLFFPRLKLFAMVIASLTMLVMDLAFPRRLYQNNTQDDIITRLIVKVFRL